MQRRHFLQMAATGGFTADSGAAPAQPRPQLFPGAITDVAGIKVGHFTETRRPAGCTVILTEEGASAGVDVRGSAPGKRETDLLAPTNLVEKVHAILLSGGSAFGLEAGWCVILKSFCAHCIIPILGDIIPKMGPKELTTDADASLGGALFSGVQQRVLGALFSNPDRSYFGNELLRLTKTGKGALQRELTRLQRVGLITVQNIGTQKHYQANRQAPIFEELHGIVIKTFGMADVLRDALATHSADIAFAFVYGSVAKRADTAESDVDLFVVSESLSYAALLGALQSPEMRLGRTINPTLMNHSELRRKCEDRDGFVARVLAQPKIMIIGSENELAKP